MRQPEPQSPSSLLDMALRGRGLVTSICQSLGLAVWQVGRACSSFSLLEVLLYLFFLLSEQLRLCRSWRGTVEALLPATLAGIISPQPYHLMKAKHMPHGTAPLYTLVHITCAKKHVPCSYIIVHMWLLHVRTRISV